MKRLFRSKTDKKLLGVCGGIGEYLGVDSTIIRLLWILGFFAFGIGLLAYLIASLIMPEDA